MTASLDASLALELEELARLDRLRVCPTLDGPDRIHVQHGARTLLSFCSNDYLGLATHPTVTAAAAEAALAYGAGASASRLVAGDLPIHRTLEAELAAFVGASAALVFPSGYQTNIGVLSALASHEDLIVSDALNHASLIDGCRLSRATVVPYRHADPDAAAAALATSGSFRRRLLVTESVFSMDGDVAPLAALAQSAHRHDAILVVDEAHALGCLGPDGRGMCAAAGVRPDVAIGALGKAFGAAGGFAAGSTVLRSYLVNRARTFLFTTALAPPVAAAALAALRVMRDTEGASLRSLLTRRVVQLRSALSCAPSPATPILPVVLGSDAHALAAAASLREEGFHVTAIRPPTVPPNTARLRITVSAAHTEAEVERLASALSRLVATSPP